MTFMLHFAHRKNVKNGNNKRNDICNFASKNFLVNL